MEKLGISTDEQDLSTGHGGSKFETSLIENSLIKNSKQGGGVLQDQSLLGHGSQDFLNSNQQSTFVPFNQVSTRTRPDDLNAQSQDYDKKVTNSLMKSSPDHHTSLMASIDSAPHGYGTGAKNQRDVRVRKQKGPNRVPLQMTKTTIDQIIYPVKTKRGLKHAPKRKSKDDSNIYKIPASLM